MEEIQRRFPGWEVWIYIGNDVPDSILATLASFPQVKLLPTNELNNVNKLYRYIPIDDPSVQIMIVRDCDSRVYDRDEKSVHQFLASDKAAQIIRDHRVHTVPILGGLWGLKQGFLQEKIFDLIQDFFKHHANKEACDYEDDQNFLRKYMYHRLIHYALIQDEFDQHFEPPWAHVKIPYPYAWPDFIGQIYMFHEDGTQYTVCGR